MGSDLTSDRPPAGRKARAIERAASGWLARQSLGALDDAGRAEFAAWRLADPAHGDAFDRMAGALARLDGAGDMVRAADRDARQASQRRVAGRTGTALGITAVALVSLVSVTDFAAEFADLRTDRAEQRVVRLADGSVLTLDAGSAADVAYDAGQRTVHLRRGRLHAQVRHGDPRPFRVAVAGGEVRDICTGFEVTLTAELSDQRSDRAHLLIMASLSRMLTEFILLYVAFNLFFHATAAFPNGQQDASAYPGYGLVMGLVMGTGMLACTAILYPAVRRMRTYRHSSPARVQGLFSLRLWHELLVASPSYRALVSAVLVFAVATGLNSALLLYLGTYLFRLTPPQMAIWSQALLVGAAICLMLGVNWVVRRFEVRSVFATAMVSYATVEVIMVAIVLLGLWPADVPLIWLLGVGNFIAGMFNAANMVAPPLLVSISADDYELRTGQPQQGLMFGLVHFAQQAGTAFGNLFAGVFLDVVAFPKGAPVSEVGMTEISAIAWFYIAAMATANIAGFTLMRGYRLRNADHDVVVRQLAVQRAQVGTDGHAARAPVDATPLGAAE